MNKSVEYLAIDTESKDIKALLRAIAFKDPSGFVSIYLPSVQINGYGNTIEEAKEMVNSTIELFFENLLKMDSNSVAIEMKNMGFVPSGSIIQDKYERPYVDQEGGLENFNIDLEQIIEDSSFAF